MLDLALMISAEVHLQRKAVHELQTLPERMQANRDSQIQALHDTTDRRLFRRNRKHCCEPKPGIEYLNIHRESLVLYRST